MSTHAITLTVNGVTSTLEVPANRTLLDLLKHHAHQPSVKGGCGMAVPRCGRSAGLTRAPPAG